MNNLRRTPLLAIAVLVVVLAGCGGPRGGGGGDESTLPDTAKATSEDPEGTTYELRAGRYRLSFRSPGCEDVVISITSDDGAFTYEQQQRVTTSFVNDLVDGTYTIAVTSDCDEWTINLNEF